MRVCVFVTHTTYCLVSWSNPQTHPTHYVPIKRSVARILHSHLPCTCAHTHVNSPLDLLPHSEDVKDSFPLPQTPAHPPSPPISRPLGVLPVPLFEGDCCFLGGCGGESSSLKERDRHTYSHEKTKGKICHVSVSLLYCQNCNLTLKEVHEPAC